MLVYEYKTTKTIGHPSCTKNICIKRQRTCRYFLPPLSSIWFNGLTRARALQWRHLSLLSNSNLAYQNSPTSNFHFTFQILLPNPSAPHPETMPPHAPPIAASTHPQNHHLFPKTTQNKNTPPHLRHRMWI